ncbi:hypothetical protein [Stigmatella hybrida]|uniref:hypothetical protein n=1 Tax=Stigmatella hybrida TaxID=394097 RepID=UPI001CDAAEFB|nr:hypothetical protein [Stigmatella hybrida]
MLDESAHVADAAGGMEVDPLGQEALTEFARVELERMSEVRERIVEAVTRMSQYLTALGPDALAVRPLLAVVDSGLQSISESFQGIDTGGAEKLQLLHDGYNDLLIAGEVVRLHWLADVLEQGS